LQGLISTSFKGFSTWIGLHSQEAVAILGKLQPGATQSEGSREWQTIRNRQLKQAD
jgi:hypothetical protein